MKTKPSLLLTSLSFLLCPLLPAGAQQQQPRFGYGALPRGAYVIPAPKAAPSAAPKSAPAPKPKPKVAATPAKPAPKPTPAKSAIAKSPTAKKGPVKEVASTKTKSGTKAKPQPVQKTESPASRSTRKTEIAKVTKTPQPAKTPAATPSTNRNRQELASSSSRDRANAERAASRDRATTTSTRTSSKAPSTAKTSLAAADKDQVRIIPPAPSTTSSGRPAAVASNNSLADLAGTAPRTPAALQFLGLPIHIAALEALPELAATPRTNPPPTRPQTTVDLIAARHSLDNSILAKSADSTASKSTAEIAAAERAAVAAAQSPDKNPEPTIIPLGEPATSTTSTSAETPVAAANTAMEEAPATIDDNSAGDAAADPNIEPASNDGPNTTISLNAPQPPAESSPEPAPVIAPEPLHAEALAENSVASNETPSPAAAPAKDSAAMDDTRLSLDDSASTHSVPASMELANTAPAQEAALESDISEPAPPALKEVVEDAEQNVENEKPAASASVTPSDSTPSDSTLASSNTPAEDTPDRSSLTETPAADEAAEAARLDADSAPALPATARTSAKPGKSMSPDKVTETPLEMAAEVEPPLPSETPPPASPAAATLSAVASTLTGDQDLSERERAFVRSLAEAAGSVATSKGRMDSDLPKSIATAASGVVDRIPRETVDTFRAVAKTAKHAAQDFIPHLPTDEGSDLMPPTPEKMPEALPAFNAQSTGKIDVQSDRQADYDQANNKVIFTGKVELNSAAIRLRAERVEVFMKKGGGGMERVEASGHVLMRTQDTENGPGQMASAGRASYNLKTGEITLSDWPKIQEAGKSHISTDASTKMYMFTDGRLRTDGPNRTLISGN